MILCYLVDHTLTAALSDYSMLIEYDHRISDAMPNDLMSSSSAAPTSSTPPRCTATRRIEHASIRLMTQPHSCPVCKGCARWKSYEKTLSAAAAKHTRSGTYIYAWEFGNGNGVVRGPLKLTDLLARSFTKTNLTFILRAISGATDANLIFRGASRVWSFDQRTVADLLGFVSPLADRRAVCESAGGSGCLGCWRWRKRSVANASC